MRGAVVLAVLWALPAAAWAQAHTPGFATIDRFDDQSKAEVVVSLAGYDTAFLSDASLETFRFDLYGQYITDGGYGGYAMLAASYAAISGDALGVELDDSGFGANNIELGGLYVLHSESFDTILRGGLTLPTASEPGADDTVDPNALAAFMRATDFVQHPADTSVLRVSASSLLWHGTAFFRVDTGLDVPIDDGATGETAGLDTLLRVNIGSGVETSGVALMGEIVNLANTDDELPDGEDRFLHFLGVSARYLGTGALQPSLALQLPLDDQIDGVIDYVLIFGVQYIAPTAKK
jgi:hypothetical protein